MVDAMGEQRKGNAQMWQRFPAQPVAMQRVTNHGYWLRREAMPLIYDTDLSNGCMVHGREIVRGTRLAQSLGGGFGRQIALRLGQHLVADHELLHRG